MYSKTRPPRWKLTQSAFLFTLWQLEDSLSLPGKAWASEDVDDLLEELRAMQEECEGSLENIPYQLQETSESGQLLRERMDGLENWIAELEGIDFDTSPGEIAQAVRDSNPGIS